MGYNITLRMQYIDVLLDEYGYINRSALEKYFDISLAQASTDIKEYLKLNPKAVKYNGSAKRYEVTQKFERIYE